MLLNLLKEKVVNTCIRTQYIPFYFHLSPLFLIHWALNPLDMSTNIKKKNHYHGVILHIIE